MESVYCAVRTGSLNKAVCASSLKVNIATTVRSAHTVFMCIVFIWEQTATCATYSINWLVFITEMESVYSAVRTRSLNKAVCLSSVKGYLRSNITYFLQHFCRTFNRIFTIYHFQILVIFSTCVSFFSIHWCQYLGMYIAPRFLARLCPSGYRQLQNFLDCSAALIGGWQTIAFLCKLDSV